MAGNRLVTEVVLVGPRAGYTGPLLGFNFEDGVAEVRTDATTALYMLGKYHNAFPRDSREHESAEAKWESASKEHAGRGAPSTAQVKAILDEQTRLEQSLAEERAELERARAELRELRAAKEAEAAKPPALALEPAAPSEVATAPKGRGKGKSE